MWSHMWGCIYVCNGCLMCGCVIIFVDVSSSCVNVESRLRHSKYIGIKINMKTNNIMWILRIFIGASSCPTNNTSPQCPPSRACRCRWNWQFRFWQHSDHNCSSCKLLIRKHFWQELSCSEDIGTTSEATQVRDLFDSMHVFLIVYMFELWNVLTGM